MRISTIIIGFLLLSLSSNAADYTLPAINQGYWEPGVEVGVPGGIARFRDGGANARGAAGGNTTIDVTASPYFVTTSPIDTTGSIAQGSDQLTVADTTGIQVGQELSVGDGWSEISGLTVTAAPTSDGDLVFTLGGGVPGATYTVPLLATDDINSAATKIRNHTYAARLTVSGTGAEIVWTDEIVGYGQNISQVSAPAGFAGTYTTIVNGSINAVIHTVTSIDGLVVTVTPTRDYYPDVTAGPVYTNNAQKITQAIGDASPGDVVYLPAGTYPTTEAISLWHTDDGITFRGDGMGQTIIECSALIGISGAGGTGSFNRYETSCSTGTRTKGTTQITVGDTSAFSDGELITIHAPNMIDSADIQAGAIPRLLWSNRFDAYQPVCRVVSVDSPTLLTIDPPLPIDLTGVTFDLYRQAAGNITTLEEFGIEEMTVKAGQTAVTGTYFDQCWFYRLEAIQGTAYILKVNKSMQCEIRQCVVGDRVGEGSGGAGILLDYATSCLVEDNIVYDAEPLIEFFNSTLNNVVTYNALMEMVTSNVIMHHASHSVLDLMEGNVMASYKSDGYFGTNAQNTLYRNFVHGCKLGVKQVSALQLKRGSYFMASVGNIYGWDDEKFSTPFQYGYPNIGNSNTNGGEATPSTGDFWIDWEKTGTVTTRNSDEEAVITVSVVGDLNSTEFSSTNGSSNGPHIYWNDGTDRVRYSSRVTNINGLEVTFSGGLFDGGDAFPTAGTAVTIWSGQPGYQEIDLDVEGTMERVENYMSAVPAPGSLEFPTADTLPASLVYAAEPSWWNEDGYNKTWPPVDPNNPGSSADGLAGFDLLPATARYFGTAAGGTMSATSATADSVIITP